MASSTALENPKGDWGEKDGALGRPACRTRWANRPSREQWQQARTYHSKVWHKIKKDREKLSASLLLVTSDAF